MIDPIKLAAEIESRGETLDFVPRGTAPRVITASDRSLIAAALRLAEAANEAECEAWGRGATYSEEAFRSARHRRIEALAAYRAAKEAARG